MPTPADAQRHPYAVFYGDSIVTGWRGTTSPHQRWPAIVCDRLAWRETTLALDGMGYFRRRGPRDANGDREPSASDTTLLDAAIRLEPDVLIVCLGANDLQFVDDHAVQIEHATRRDLMRLSTDLPDSTAVVVTTYFPTTQLSLRAQRIENCVVQACREHGLTYVEAFRSVIGGDRRLLCDDGVHPNDEGHHALADLMAPILRDVIGS